MSRLVIKLSKNSLLCSGFAARVEGKSMSRVVVHKDSAVRGRHLPARRICLRNPGWIALAAMHGS